MSKKLNNLQVLRGFAALNVAFFHIIGTSSSYGFGVHHLNIFEGWGYSGLDIFFVLSGFIMVYIQRNKEISPAIFFMDRLIRIAPLYWFLTIIVLIAASISPSIFRSNISDIKIHSLLSILFMSQYLLGKMPVLFDGWSLEYEMLFYLIISLALLFKKKNITYLFTVTLISLLIIFNLLGIVAFEFIFGIFLGNIFLYSKKNINIHFFCLFIGLILYILTLAVFRLDGGIYTHRIFLFGLPASLVIFGLLGISQIHEGFLTKLGDASFSIYLIQVFTIPAFYKLMILSNSFGILSHDLLAVVCLVFTAVGGYLLYEIVEIRLTKLVRAFFPRI